jgi:RAB6A-GEF complex partner protein 1
MYWPIGTPRVYATSSNQASHLAVVVSHDGLPNPSSRSSPDQARSSLLAADSIRPGQEDLDLPTPVTPLTPAVQSIEDDDHDGRGFAASPFRQVSASIPVGDPILALKVSRIGHIFATITSTSITIWQTKVREARESPQGRSLTCMRLLAADCYSCHRRSLRVLAQVLWRQR